MRVKKVYLNDILVGEAASWAEVRELLKAMGIAFVDKPGMAEGPTGFYVSGTVTAGDKAASKKAGDVA